MGWLGRSSNPGFVTFQLWDSDKVFISSVSLIEGQSPLLHGTEKTKPEISSTQGVLYKGRLFLM